MSVQELDRQLLIRCLETHPRAWEDFVDRFMGMVLHVVSHTANIRGLPLSDAERDMLCEEVFIALCHDSFRILREYDHHCQLATYMTIVTRRIAVRLLFNKKMLA